MEKISFFEGEKAHLSEGELRTRPALFLRVERIVDGVPFMCVREVLEDDNSKEQFKAAWLDFLENKKIKVEEVTEDPAKVPSVKKAKKVPSVKKEEK